MLLVWRHDFCLKDDTRNNTARRAREKFDGRRGSAVGRVRHALSRVPLPSPHSRLFCCAVGLARFEALVFLRIASF